MEVLSCKICGEQAEYIFTQKVLGTYNAHYYRCKVCDFIQTEKPYWLAEAYAKPINVSDTGYLYRNYHLAKKTAILFFLFFGKAKRYLDYGGGYGVFVRIMRDRGFDYYWQDPYVKNLFAEGFEYISEKPGIAAISCFECFEHLENPLTEIAKMLALSKNILFSTELTPAGKIPDLKWGYYGFHHGQHVALYSKKTLQCIAKKYGLNFYTNGRSLHLFTARYYNPFVVSILMYGNKLYLDKILGLFMRSKTVSDSEFLSVSK